jgi:glycosyltransferase involved in cell wall biosynthesis
MKILVSHPTGNVFCHALVTHLAQRNALEGFLTAFNPDPDRGLWCCLPNRWRSQVRRRALPAVVRPLTHTHGLREALRLAVGFIGCRALSAHEHGPLSVDQVFRTFDRWASQQLKGRYQPQVVYGYEDAAVHLFEAALGRGMSTAYELPIAYWKTAQELLARESARWPDWRVTMPGVDDSREKLARKDRELELAQAVVVPSQFVADSLPSVVRARVPVHVIPFGSPVVTITMTAVRSVTAPLRVLFVGSLTQRKGLADLIEAMGRVRSRHIQLVVMGTPVAPLEFYKERWSAIEYHPPGPRTAVLELMQRCDVFVFPSLLEGRALVQHEAMACGLPLLATRNAGADDLIEDGVTGFLLPAADPQAIADRLDWCASNRQQVGDMGEAARRRVVAFTWSAYGSRILEVLQTEFGCDS